MILFEVHDFEVPELHEEILFDDDRHQIFRDLRIYFLSFEVLEIRAQIKM